MSKHIRITFNPDMVQAIREGRKVQTRRISDIKASPGDTMVMCEEHWVDRSTGERYFHGDELPEDTKLARVPGFYLPVLQSRYKAKIIGVRREKLHSIKYADMMKEGAPDSLIDPTEWWINLWDSINGEKEGCAWADNPMVTVIEWEKS